jgi:hypothetical protein
LGDEQIVGILKQGEAGVPVVELLRRHGISRATYCPWRSKYAGTTVSELGRMKASLGGVPPSESCPGPSPPESGRGASP